MRGAFLRYETSSQRVLEKSPNTPICRHIFSISFSIDLKVASVFLIIPRSHQPSLDLTFFVARFSRPETALTSTMCRHQSSAVVDVNTNSNFKDVVTKHTEIEVTIDFERTVLVGSTTITFESRLASLTEIVLDTSYLTVKEASINGAGVSWDLKAPKDANGSPLHIYLDRAYENGEAFELAVSSGS